MSNEVPRFGRQEFVARIGRLQQAMGERELDLMLLDDIEILAYFTGYERSISYYRACLVPVSGDPVMVLRSLDTAPFLETSWLADCVGYADTEDAVEVLARVIQEKWGGRAAVGIDFGSHGLTIDAFRRIRTALPNTKFVAMTGIPWELRLIKSPAEIQHLSQAASIADQTMLEITTMARPGMSGRDLSAHAARRYIELGALPGHVGPVTYGKGWGFLHGQLHDTALEPGDILHLELVPRFRGYSARLMRSVVMGQPSPQQQQAARLLIDLQDRQLAAMTPGARACEVDAVLRQGVLQAGLRDSYDNITGYTLGYYSQQPVRSSDFTRVFSPREDWLLEAGMVFHMYTSAQGLAFSETVHVGTEGARRLTRLDRKLYAAL